jgi:hypothetical protein
MPFNADCPACKEKRLHTDEEWKNHPQAGQGSKVGDGRKQEEKRKDE